MAVEKRGARVPMGGGSSTTSRPGLWSPRPRVGPGRSLVTHVPLNGGTPISHLQMIIF